MTPNTMDALPEGASKPARLWWRGWHRRVFLEGRRAERTLGELLPHWTRVAGGVSVLSGLAFFSEVTRSTTCSRRLPM